MGLIKFDFLFAEMIREDGYEIEYKCTMDKNYSEDSHTFIIIKSAFENVYNYQNDLAGYVFVCLENKSILIPKTEFNRDLTLDKIGLDRIAAIRYLFASYLEENEIPKNIGIISERIETQLINMQNEKMN